MRRRSLLLSLLLCSCTVEAAPQRQPPVIASASPPQRILSLDYCADQFLLELADRSQILALSPDAEKDFSYLRADASGLQQVRPRGEEVLALQPDLVLRSYGGEANLVELLSRAGTPIAQLQYADDFPGIEQNIRAMAKAVGHPERGERVVRDMRTRLARAAAAPGPSRRVLYVTAAGVTTGDDSLVGRILNAAGLENFESTPGWRPIPLERLATEQPDLVAAAFFGSSSDHAASWSEARHPIVQQLLRERPTVILDGAWTSCGGWFVLDAVEALAAQRTHLAGRK